MAERKQHIWLCGFMGCGKSTVGAELARLIGSELIDMDSYIEQREQMTIPEIFRIRGEAYFRELETVCVTELCNHVPAVIATGGGAMISQQNVAEAKKSGVVLFLDIPFKDCYQRIQNTDRPIVRRSSQTELKQLYQQRREIYKKHADLIFNGVLSPIDTANKIADILAAF